MTTSEPATQPALSESGRPRPAPQTSSLSGVRVWVDNLGLAWFVLLAGTYSFSSKSANEVLSGQLSSSNLIRYACMVIALALITPELRGRIALRVNALWLFGAYVVVCLLSFLWSVSPVASFGKAAELAVATAIVILAANRPNSARALDQLFTVTFAFGAAVLLTIAVGYVLGLDGFWIHSKGVIERQMDAWFLSANNIGYLSALTATIALDRALGRAQGRYLMWAAFALSLFTIVAAQGRTGIACMAIGVGAVLFIRRKYKVLIALAGVALLIGLVFNEAVLSYLTRGEPTGSLQTLTGRTVIWEGAWQSFMQRPLTGNGFGVGGRYLFVSVFAGAGEDWSSAHNGLLELLTGVGLLGFAPWIVSVLWTIWNAFRFAWRRVLAGAPAVIAMMPVMTIMYNGAAGWFDVTLAYFLCCAAILGHRIPRGLRARRARQPR